MTNEQILKKAIEKAVKSGLDIILLAYDIGSLCKEALLENLEKHTHSIIFSRSFAKAYWGEKLRHDINLDYDEPIWQYHLQQMVLAKDKFKYLEKFLDEN